MATFTQPINRAADLKAVMDGYEQAIQKTNWLSEALQKDGIQNAWGARKNSNGKEWEARIVYYENAYDDSPLIFIEDSGTFGLTGDVPNNEQEEIALLESNDSEQRLCRFLSSNWSVKTENTLGSRGRGKMVFIGASRRKQMYFETIKSDDNIYVFGRTYLASDKTMKVEVYKEQQAHEQRVKTFGAKFPQLNHVGTRIIIPQPVKELAEAVKDRKIAESIQLTWWEILSKHEASILIGLFENPVRVELSPWLPISNSGLRKNKSYQNIPVEKGSSLKIKRISLVYLEDKEIPLNYQGIAVQRAGMNIQIRPIGKILDRIQDGKVYGSIELGKHLDDAMLKLEGPEHYTFTWNKGVAHKVNREVKKIVKEFAKEFKILDDERKSASKERREAESAVQKELNAIAKSIGLSGIASGTTGQKRQRKQSTITEKIQISIPDFKTPHQSGQVNTGQEIAGAYALASSTHEEHLSVSFQVWVYREGGFNIPGLRESREGRIGAGITPLNAGWNNIKIDDRFEKGHYYFKAKIISLENKILDNNTEVEKGDILYREISRPFWVDEEPPAKGFFRDIRSQSKASEKDKYVWWEHDDGCILFYNDEHPRIKEIIDDDDLYKDFLRKEGALVLWTIVLDNAIANPEDMNKKIRELTKEVEELSVEGQILWLLERRSETLWGK